MVLCVMEFGCAGLWVAASLLGQEFDLSPTDGSANLVLRLPKEADSFKEELGGAARAFDGFTEHHQTHELVSVEIKIIQMRVTFAATIPYHEVEKEESPDGELRKQATALSHKAESLASESLARFLDHARVAGQYWLGMSMQRPELIHGPVVYDDSPASTRRLPTGVTLGPVAIRNPNHALNESQVRHVASETTNQSSPTLADRILADACYLADQDAPASLRHAVLLAAVSSEIRIKETLRIAATDEKQRRLVELLFESPRDFSMAVSALLRDPFRIIVGHSLQDDDSKLYKATEKLFSTRNKIVHSGSDYADEELRKVIVTAQQLAKYLDGVLP